MSEAKQKVTVELEFDDPTFLEFYQKLAIMRGTSLGRIAALCMQDVTSMFFDGDTGEFEDWGKRLFKGKEKALLHSWITQGSWPEE
jgi:hypothetical protein